MARVVSSVSTHHGDASIYTVRWSDGSESSYSTYEVLEDAIVGQGVVPPEEDRTNFKNFLCATMVVLYVHVYLFAIQDDNQNKKPSKGSVLRKPAEKTKEVIARDLAWDTIKDLRAVDCVNDHELKLVQSDTGLERELEKDGSLLRMLRLSGDKNGLLEHKNLQFNPKHKRLVRHILRGAQQA